MPDANTAFQARSTLDRIARALDVAPDTFLRDGANAAVCPEAQDAECLRLFRAIQDPDLRRHCLALLRSAAGQASGGSGVRVSADTLRQT